MNKIVYTTGGFKWEAVVLESSEAAGEGQMRGTTYLALLPSQQQCAYADTSEGTEFES